MQRRSLGLSKFRCTPVSTTVRLLLALAFVFAIISSVIYTYTRVLTPAPVSAATSSNLNYQGRLKLTNGSLVPDGDYHIEFKLYTGGTSGGPGGVGEANAGSLVWTETRTTGNLVRVVNGYFSVNLGSVTAFGGGINWDQEHWLTMNIGGSGGSPSWDGEMLATGNKRTKLTAVPYAFVSGNSAQLGGVAASDYARLSQAQTFTAANTIAANSASALLIQKASAADTLFTVDTTNNRVKVGNDTASASADTTLFVVDSAGSTVNLPVGVNGGIVYDDQADKFKVYENGAWKILCNMTDLGCGTGGGGGVADLQGAYNGSTNPEIVLDATRGALTVRDNSTPLGANLFEVQNNDGTTTYFKVASNGTAVKTSTNSTSAFNVQNAIGTTVLNADSTNVRLGIGTAAPATTLHIVSPTPTIRLEDASNVPINISDDFNRADNTSLGTDWTERCGDWAIASNRATYPTTNGCTGLAVIHNTGGPYAAADYSVQTTMTRSGAPIPLQVGVIGRRVNFSTSDSDGYILYANSTVLTLAKRVSGGNTTLGTYSMATWTNGGSITVKLVMSGTTIKGYLNGVERITATDSSLSSAGDAGIIAGATSDGLQSYDNFSVGPVPASTNIGQLSFSNNTLSVTDAAAVSTTSQALDFANNNFTSTANLINNGTALFKNVTDTSASFQIQNAAGNALLSADTTSNNLISSANASFEAATTWSAKGTITGASRNTNFAYIGANSLQISTNGNANTGQKFGGYALLPNTTYNFSMYVHSDQGTLASGTLLLGRQDDNATDTSCAAGPAVTSTGWTQLSCTFTTGGTITGGGNIYIKQTDAATRIFYIDGVQLTLSSLLANQGAEIALGAGNWVLKGAATVTQDATQFNSGTKSVKIVTTTAAADGVKQNITLADSTTYTLSFYAKLDGASAALTTMAAGYSSDGSTDGNTCTQNQTVVSTGWAQYTCTLITPASHSGTPFLYIKHNSSTAHTFYIDDVQLTQGRQNSPAYGEGRLYVNSIVSSPLIVQNSSDSTTALQVMSAAGSPVFTVDTANNKIIVGTNTALDFGGTNNTLTRGDATTIFVNSSLYSAGSINAGGTSKQALISSYGTSGAAGGNYYGKVGASQTGDALKLVNNSDQVLAQITSSGSALFRNDANSTSAIQIQNAAGASLFNIDSVNANINLNGLNTGEIQTWQTTNSLGGNRQNHTSVVANGYVYAIGGDSGVGESTVYYAKLSADGTTSTWTTTTALPSARYYHSSVFANGYVYVFGGSDGSSPQSTVLYAKVKSDGTLGSWQTNTANPLPATKTESRAVTANGYVYVIGGSGGAGSNTVYYAKLSADGSIGSWTSSGNTLSLGRTGHTAVTANGYMYVMGGGTNLVSYAKLNADGTTSTFTDETDTLPASRSGHSSVVANGYLYVLGGQSANSAYIAALNNDGSTGAWASSSIGLPDLRRGHTSVFANGYIYTIGGFVGASVTPDVKYTSVSRIKMGGSLDLVGAGGENLADGGTGGELTAGNSNILGQLYVSGDANIKQGLNVGGEFIAGSSVLFRNSLNSTNAFQIQNAAGSPDTLFTANTTNNRIIVGNGTASAGTDTTLFVVDSTALTANLPTGVNGGMVYDAQTNKFKIYENSAWKTICNTTDLGCGSGTISSTKVVSTSATAGPSGATASLNYNAADYINSSNTSAQTTINTAITAVNAAGGGTVYLMEGTYVIDGSINMLSNVNLVGSGAGTVIKMKASTASSTTMITNAGTVHRVRISNFKLDGNRAAQGAATNQIGIYSNSGSSVTPGITIDNMSIEGTLQNGIFISGYAATVSNNSVYDTGTTGDGINVQADYSKIIGNTVRSISAIGIYTYGDYNIISDNIIKDVSGSYGIQVLSFATNVTISGNTIDGVTTGTGINTSANYTAITGNTVANTANNGIEVVGSSNNSIVNGNVLKSVGTGGNSGIYVANGAYNTISNNRIDSYGTGVSANHGINLNTSTYTTVIGNQITDTGTGSAISTCGIGNTLSGNSFSGTGAATIADSCNLGTVYSSQTNSTGDIALQSSSNAVNINNNGAAATATLTVRGAYSSTQLSTPAQPTVATVGTAGTIDYTYTITASDGVGETLPATVRLIATGNATLNSSNFNRITWTKVNGAFSYKVYRTAVEAGGSPSSTGYIGTVLNTAAAQFDDTGIAATGSLPTVNTTGGGTFAGNVGIGTSTPLASLHISASGVGYDLLRVTDTTSSTNVFTVADGGLVSFQPAASLTSGQSNISQTFTNGSSTGGTVNGLNQSITISNTSSGATTNGINISLNETTSLANTDVGVNIVLTGGNSGAAKYALYGTVDRGVGVYSKSSNVGSSQDCAYNVTGSISVGLCAESVLLAGSTNVTGGVIGGTRVSTGTNALNNAGGAGVYGQATPDPTGTGGVAANNYVGVKGQSKATANAAYNSVGVYGDASGGTGSSVYGGYFTLNGGGATSGAGLHASNGSNSANIFQLQDGTSTGIGIKTVMTVADEGATTFQNRTDSTAAFKIQSSTTSDILFTANTTSNQLKVGNDTGSAAADYTLLVLDKVGATANLPVGTNGGMIYDDQVDKFKIYENGAWKTLCNTTDLGCGTGGGGVADLQGAYDGGASAAILTTNARDLTITLADTATDPNMLINIASGSTGKFAVQSNGTDVLGVNADGNVGFGAPGGFSDSPTKLSNPATLPAGTAEGVAFSPDGVYMTVAHATSPYITIYKRSGDTFTKLANPSTLPTGSAEGVEFSPDGTYMSVAHNVSPYVTIYKRSGDTFTKLANPSTLPTGWANGVAFSQDGTYMTVAHTNSPYFTIYKRSGDTFTKLPDPATLPNYGGQSVDFSPDGTYMTVTDGMSPFILIYKRNGDTFTKLANPASIPTGFSSGSDFSPDGLYLAVTDSSSPRVFIYKRSGDTFTKLSDPASLPAGSGTSVKFSPDGTYLTVAHQTSPFITIYKRSGDTFTKLSDPASLPAGDGRSVDFSPDGTYMAVAHWLSPYVAIYKGSGSAIHQIELGTGLTRYDGIGFGKELSLYRSGPGVVSLAAGGSLKIDSGNLIVQGSSNDSAGAFQVQNNAGGSILTADTANSQVLFGNSSNTAGKLVVYGTNGNAVTLTVGATASYNLTLPTSAGSSGECLKNSATPGVLTWGACSGAGSGKRISLIPEFPGAIISADGTNNSGTMTTDFVSGVTGNKHSFYEWSTDQGSEQDYRIVVNYQLPSDFSAFTASSFHFWTYTANTAGTNPDISLMIEDVDGTDCFASEQTLEPASNSTWTDINPSNPGNGCTFAANEIITFTFNLRSVSPQTDKVRLGEFYFEY